MITRWRLETVPDWPSGLNVELTADTVAPAVIEAVELAAIRHGIRLVRLPQAAGDALVDPGWIQADRPAEEMPAKSGDADERT